MLFLTYSVIDNYVILITLFFKGSTEKGQMMLWQGYNGGNGGN